MRAGCHYDLGDTSEKVTLRTLGPEAPDRAAAEAISEVMRCTRNQEYDAGWEAFQATDASHASLSGAALNLCAKARWWDRAWGIWSGLPQEWRTVVPYTTMIDLCARCRRARDAEDLFAEMRSASVEPNIITHNSLIKAFAMASMPEAASQAFSAVPKEVLKSAGLRTQRTSYQTVMIAWAREGNYARARELFMSMCDAAVSPDTAHYNALLVSCARSGDGSTADGVFSSLLSAGLQPDLTIYTIRISCHRFDLARCLEILKEMREADLKPTTSTYVELLEAHVLAGDGEGARALLEGPELRDAPPSGKLKRLAASAQALGGS